MPKPSSLPTLQKSPYYKVVFKAFVFSFIFAFVIAFSVMYLPIMSNGAAFSGSDVFPYFFKTPAYTEFEVLLFYIFGFSLQISLLFSFAWQFRAREVKRFLTLKIFGLSVGFVGFYYALLLNYYRIGHGAFSNEGWGDLIVMGISLLTLIILLIILLFPLSIMIKRSYVNERLVEIFIKAKKFFNYVLLGFTILTFLLISVFAINILTKGSLVEKDDVDLNSFLASTLRNSGNFQICDAAPDPDVCYSNIAASAVFGGVNICLRATDIAFAKQCYFDYLYIQREKASQISDYHFKKAMIGWGNENKEACESIYDNSNDQRVCLIEVTKLTDQWIDEWTGPPQRGTSR